MDKKELEQLFNAVEDINYDIFEYIIDKYYNFELQISSNACCYSVKFLGISIWKTKDDDRKFDEDKNEYEPWDDFLKRKMSEIIEKVKKIRI